MNKKLLALGVSLLLPMTALATENSYEMEVSTVLSNGLVKENPTTSANKCEILTIMARFFEWDLKEVSIKHAFGDVPNWCDEVANYASTKEIIKGRSEKILGLETPITRNEVAVMLYRELGRQNFEFTGNTETSFKDEIPTWAKEAVEKLAKEGILKGFGASGEFGGELSVLKQDFAIMLNRLENTKIVMDQEAEDTRIYDSWQFVESTVSDLSSTAEKLEKDFVISLIRGGRFEVGGDCNAISGRYVYDAQTTNFTVDEAIAMTKMFCEDSYENQFLNDLRLVTNFEIPSDSPNKLVLTTKDSDGKNLGKIIFHRTYEIDEEILGAWNWKSTEFGETKKSADDAKTPFILTLNRGTLGIQGDCNSIGGEFMAQNGKAKFENFIQTLMFCDGSYENGFTEALSLVNQYEIIDNKLTFNGSDKDGVKVKMEFEKEEIETETTELEEEKK
jgi:heat shock protein HslJ